MADAPKKKAVSAYFSKGKAKRAAAADPVPEVEEEAPAPVILAPPPAVAPPSGAAAGWVDSTEDEMPTLSQRHAVLRQRVVDMSDEQFEMLTGEVLPTADIDADDARDKFWNARSGARGKKAKQQSDTLAAPAPAPVSGWRAKLEARKAGSSSGIIATSTGRGVNLDTHNMALFPSLSGATSGRPEPEVARVGSKGAWGVFADALDDSEEEEEAAAPAPAATATASVVPKAAVAKSTQTGPTGNPTLRLGSGEQLVDDDAVREVAQTILRGLRSSGDVDAAVDAIAAVHCDDVNRRERVLEVLLQGGLDSEKDADRVAVNAVLTRAIPGGAVTAAMIVRAVTAMLAPEVYDELVVDIPRAASYFATMLKGCIDYGGAGSTGSIPVVLLPEPVARLLPNPKAPAAAAPAPLAQVAVVAEDEEPLADAPEPAAADDDVDLESMFASKTKKKKKAAKGGAPPE